MSEDERRRHSEPGYYGVPFKDLPEGLRERVQAAAQAASKGRRFGLCFLDTAEVYGKAEWRYHDYTDVFAFDDNHMYASYHQAGGKMYHTYRTGGGEPRYIDDIAEIIPGLGWRVKVSNGKTVNNFTRQATITGPYYGMKLNVPETK